MKKIWELFITFAKIGTFTFGGGYAMLSLLQKEVVENHKWATEEELLDYYAIAQCTPGVIAVNTATFVGAKRSGILGGICATLGVLFPSVIIITIIAAFINHFLEYEIVQHILGGIRVAVAVLIINSVITMSKKSMVDVICVIIAIVSFLLSLIFSLSPILIVLAAGALGLILKRGGSKK
ncbi:MAG: chromate transporter [Oscillospiraceae bacterium]|nr:chromate transporter [Oscillospiraceae bacterium]